MTSCLLRGIPKIIPILVPTWLFISVLGCDRPASPEIIPDSYDGDRGGANSLDTYPGTSTGFPGTPGGGSQGGAVPPPPTLPGSNGGGVVTPPSGLPGGGTGAGTGAGTGSGAGSDTSAQQVIANGNYFIKAAGAMKCLSVPNNSRDNEVQLQIRGCDTNASDMKFAVQFLASEKAYVISNLFSKKFVEVRNQMEVPQAAVQQNDYFGLKHQMFLIERKEQGRYYIRTKTNMLYVDVTAANTADGTPIQLWNDGNGISSVWILDPAL